jgi:hypothetical protein
MARYCTRCGKQLGMLETVTAGESRRCKDCGRAVKQYLQEWRKQFLAACAGGLLTTPAWAALQQSLQQNNITQTEAVAVIRKEALGLVTQTLAFTTTDGQIGEGDERNIRWLIEELQLAEVASHILQQVNYLSTIRNIRQGNIPRAKTSIVLPSDEICYLEIPATYRKTTKSGAKLIQGRLIVTNRKVIFSAPSGGGEIPINKVLNVHKHPEGIFLELSRQANHGFYMLAHSELVAEIILATIRLATRQMLKGGERDTRYVPHHLQNAVWHRDGGQCVQCGSTAYLEYDHIIPLSKGGATSLNNLQVLCRNCNLAKGSRI